MAQTYVDVDGTLMIPGAYAKVGVVAATGGIATTGVITLLGEAEMGASYSDEDVALSSFGPDQFASVVAKYGSGPLVDGYRAAANASLDPQVTGSPDRIFLVKTNVSGKASLSLTRSGLTAYGTLRAKNAGQLGNLLYSTVTQTAEVSPTITVAVAPNTGVTPSVKFRVNGGTEVTTLTYATGTDPATWLGTWGNVGGTLPTSILGNAGLSPTGCIDRGVLGITATITAAQVSGAIATFTVSGALTQWTVVPTVGDLLYVSGGLAAAGNLGYFVVTAATTSTITATKVHNNGASSITNPTAESNSCSSVQFRCFSPLTIKNLAGTNRSATTGNVSLTVSAGATQVTVTNNTGSWANRPQTGDFVYVPNSANVISVQLAGWSQVVSATANTVVLTRLSNGSYGGGATDTDLAPSEFIVYRPNIDGVGKSIEIYSTTTAGYFWNTATAAAAPWDVTGAVPVVYTGTEPTATINVARASDNIDDSYTVGGKVVLKVGYAGTTCSVVVSATSIVLTPSGGSGSPQTALFKDFATLKDLAVWINSKTGFSCSVGANVYNQLSPTALDRGTFTAGSSGTSANQTLLLKADAYYTKLAIANSSVVEFSTSPTSGLPDTQSIGYFTGGTKGATTANDFLLALAAAERVTTNFTVPCFSRNATDDIADNLTDTASDYTIAGIHAATLDHVIRMSKYKARKPQEGILSFRGAYVDAKDAAQALASARTACTFLDVKALASDGTVKQFQPWYLAALVAGFQAAAGYRPTFNKLLNCSGVLQAAGDWFPTDDSNVEDAIQAGLLVARERPTGGFSLVSDQTTYAVDNNFVYNSIQAMYGADTVAMTIAQQMELAFVGQSFSDVSAAVALSYLKGILADLRRLRYITASDDAPNGYKNAKVEISAPAMRITVEVKLGTGVYFIPINVLVSQVQQTAQQ